jgi:hypothetical protein
MIPVVSHAFDGKRRLPEIWIPDAVPLR